MKEEQGAEEEWGWGRRKENIHFKSSLKNQWRLISPRRLTGETRRGGLRHVTTDFTQWQLEKLQGKINHSAVQKEKKKKSYFNWPND